MREQAVTALPQMADLEALRERILVFLQILDALAATTVSPDRWREALLVNWLAELLHLQTLGTVSSVGGFRH